MSIEQTEAECAANAVAPRVTLEAMEAKIAACYEFTADKLGEHPSLSVLSICLLVVDNGYTVIGKSAPADARNFNRELGRRLAYEDAIRQLWPLEGYLLRERSVARYATGG